VSRKLENTGFTCLFCGAVIHPLTNGCYRNHCPKCLYSLHIDNKPGDRANDCFGLMKPVNVRYHGKKGWQIIHRCDLCGIIKMNRTAPDDIDTVILMMEQVAFNGGFNENDKNY